ncbi:MAG: hypothetical protein ABL309_02285 [Phycisphaerales bacterium]
MNDQHTNLLEQRLEAWGRAETHAVSKQLPEPPPAFRNAVHAEAVRRRAIAITAIGCVVVVILAALAWIAWSNRPAPPPPIMTDIPEELEMLDSDRALPLIGGAAPRRHLR